MKVKLDENMPTGLGEALTRLGHDVRSILPQGLTGREDVTVWEASQDEERLLITQDMDFSQMERFAPGAHHGILLVRLRQPGRRALLERVVALFEAEDVLSWRGCFVVATDRKLRVRGPRSR